MISWATNAEDVVLARALPSGFGTYLDVGAGDPDEGSATRLLAERGWYGISVVADPGAADRHRERRPADVTVELPAGDPPAASIDAVLEDFSKGPLDLLRIGHPAPAGALLAGADLARWRPRVVLVEAVDPVTGAGGDTGDWRAPLRAAGYTEALFDGVNHFFATTGEPDLLARLAVPASSLDRYQPWTSARLAEEVTRLRERVGVLERVADERSGVAAGTSRLAVHRTLHVPDPPAGLPERRPAVGSPGPGPHPPARLALVGSPGGPTRSDSRGSWLGTALAAVLGAELRRADHPADVAWGSLPGSVVVELAWPRTRLLERTLAGVGMIAVCPAGAAGVTGGRWEDPAGTGRPAPTSQPARVPQPAGGDRLADPADWNATWTSTPTTVRYDPEDLLADPAGAVASILGSCGLTPAFDPEEVMAGLGAPTDPPGGN